MSMLVRYPGYLPETPSQMQFGDWFLLRKSARWPAADELDWEKKLYWYSAPVGAIVFKTLLDDASVFTYRNPREAAEKLSAFFERTIEATHSMIRGGPSSGRGIAFHVTDATKVWAPRPTGVVIRCGWGYSADDGMKDWTLAADASADVPAPAVAGRRLRRDLEDLALPLADWSHFPAEGTEERKRRVA